MDLDETLAALEGKANRLQAATIQDTGNKVKAMEVKFDDLSRMHQAQEKTLDRMMRILTDQKQQAKCKSFLCYNYHRTDNWSQG